MGKVENKIDEFAGDTKEAVGDATDNERLQAEGAAQSTGAKVKQAGEHLKDAARDIKRTLTD